jgi:hypothetical protein
MEHCEDPIENVKASHPLPSLRRSPWLNDLPDFLWNKRVSKFLSKI